ncbi:translation factor GTPase family protein [Sporosarcina pasteurii]|uniref:Tetracycline resistance protein tetM n=1 Tax=Sporosarcina pasteurii TaxID=1474 RepID=A0A380CHD9_SPOPA|nr:TetM/TetW/TetO/TetS family tetracycline resistance ribosomal protection protein [Sporosarcina pasteurii]MDS9472098.1 TetM/TetW/TetO/TetS family tetracycline resistance ribosomal protection protein [Sporosarcina pasteurii]QBQ06817.1 TetM/TetW/TetO/TetS family tetracycline resistance ribosomal protection protein [Sporosarcina pasteurii]SUJ20800.1 Tetracycline resistance protein tetM [Sporosarcina pasteurii]
MYKTIGVLAHVDAGKTTFSEQLLYHTNSIRQRGRVDHQDTFLDTHDIEKSRGITVFADQAMFTYGDSMYTLIDTPGHVDFSPEMERAIQVMDYAIVIISAVDGVEGHTETVWQLLRKHRIPTFFFINKIDREGANVENVIQDIQVNLTADVYDFTSAFEEGVMQEGLVEFIAERNEALLDHYLEVGYDAALWLETLKTMITENQIFVCTSGSALKDISIVEFLALLDTLTETTYSDEGEFAAKVYKIRHDESGNRVTFLKSLSGILRVRDEVKYGEHADKITQIRLYNGSKYQAVDKAHAGTLFAVTGLTNTTIGDSIGALEANTTFELVPTLTSTVEYDASIHVKEVLKCFHMLDAEDPSLHVIWNEHFEEIHVHVMGAIQLEVLKQVVQERFGMEVHFGTPKILYKETVETTVIGYGHFEPLRHYAEVHLKIEPAERNSGISFENNCHADHLSVGYQNLIRQHIFEREHNGLLTGSGLTDVKITLLTGRAHNEHTSGGDFREATYRALRQGLEQAQNILLEPYYDFKIKVELDMMGRILSDIQQAHGTFQPPETIGNHTMITGKVPVATFMDYSQTFASITNGKGALSLKYSGYDVCHNADEVIDMIGYDKNADPEYTSTSIFCAKGKGYSVPWDQAKDAMHCL